MMFAAVAGLLHTAAVQRPLALMLDDLHWADGPTLLMLKYLLVIRSCPRWWSAHTALPKCCAAVRCGTCCPSSSASPVSIASS